jgi:hypothetical protein
LTDLAAMPMRRERSPRNKKAAVMIEGNGRRAARAGHLRDLLHDCVGSPASNQAACLIEAARLLRSAAEVTRVEAMVACDAFESAASLVLGPDRPFLVSRGATGLCLATTLIASGETEEREATGEGATPALALLAALAAALLAEESKAGMRTQFAVSTHLARLH